MVFSVIFVVLASFWFWGAFRPPVKWKSDNDGLSVWYYSMFEIFMGCLCIIAAVLAWMTLL